MKTGPTQRFSVQGFREKGQGLEADRPQEALSLRQALRKVEGLAADRAGAVVVRHDGDPELGDDCEPVVVKVIGRVPAIFLRQPA